MARPRFWWQVFTAALHSHSNRQFYDRISPIYDRVFVKHRKHAQNMTEIMRTAYAGRERMTRVLDLGCGTGMLSRMLAADGSDVTGLDISLKSLQVMRRSDKRIEAIQGDASHLPFTDDAFQVVVSLGSWRHFSEPEQVLAELNRLLGKNGFFIAGYFPPAIGGVVHLVNGFWSRLLIRIYHFLTGKLGFEDHADSLLEERTTILARKYFKQVDTVDSGEKWHLIVAIDPCTSLINTVSSE